MQVSRYVQRDHISWAFFFELGCLSFGGEGSEGRVRSRRKQEGGREGERGHGKADRRGENRAMKEKRRRRRAGLCFLGR
jgi:hypothetical protein